MTDPETESPQWQFWNVVAQAEQAGAVKLHLRPGHPPLLRRADRSELAPLAPEAMEINSNDLMRELSAVVEPEVWPRLEAEGGGDFTIVQPEGGSLRLALFRGNGVWNAVVHL